MSAQELQILDNNNLGPWYSADFPDILDTPE